MTDRELMQMALDALEWCYDVTEWPANGKSAQDKAIEALRARLAQPEPDNGYCQACDGDSCTAKNGCVALDNPKAQPEPEPVAYDINGATVYIKPPVYTAPPQREWQGLTDEEIENFVQAVWPKEAVPADYVRAIEAKLKEKNCAT